MTRPLVSIVVNVYRGEQYVRECLDSVLALRGDYPLQVLVVDDASPDGTADILRSYSDHRLELVILDENRGVRAAINHAFERVKGEFVARIDYDDRYDPDFLVKSVPALIAHPQAAFVCAKARLIDEQGKPTGVFGPWDYGQEPGCRDRFFAILDAHFVTAPTVLGRTAHWCRTLPLPEGMNFADWYMNLGMAESAPVVVLDEVTADYRVHPQGMHSTFVATGEGERLMRRILERYLEGSEREPGPGLSARRIRAGHLVDWGNKYFGVRLNGDATRCYYEAVRTDPSVIFRARFLHRLVGLWLGREPYEWLKSRVRRPGR